MCLLFSLCDLHIHTCAWHMCLLAAFPIFRLCFRTTVWRRRRRVRNCTVTILVCVSSGFVLGWKISGAVHVIYPEFAAWLVKNQGKLLASLRQSNENSLRKMHNFQVKKKKIRSSFIHSFGVEWISIENFTKCTQLSTHTRLCNRKAIQSGPEFPLSGKFVHINHIERNPNETKRTTAIRTISVFTQMKKLCWVRLLP